MTWPTWTAARTKDSNTKKFAATNHTPSPFNIEEAWILTWERWFFGTRVHHLLGLLAFRIKSILLAPATRLLIYWPVVWWVSSSSLDSVTVSPKVKHIELPCDSAIPLLGLYPKELKTDVQAKTCAQMFITPLFTIAKRQKQPQCPSMYKCIKCGILLNY